MPIRVIIGVSVAVALHSVVVIEPHCAPCFPQLCCELLSVNLIAQKVIETVLGGNIKQPNKNIFIY